MNELRFILPPALGARAGALAEPLRKFLGAAFPDREPEVLVAPSYEDTATLLIEGRAELAWAPPFICARVVSAGGSALVRALRDGCSTFRSALVCRTGAEVSVPSPRKLKAAWVDAHSTGYLLPRLWLRGLGLRSADVFGEERFAGSYAAALTEVLEGRADVTAVYASAEGSAFTFLGTELLAPADRARLKVFAWTPECPNDAIAASPRLDGAAMQALKQGLLRASGNPGARAALKQIFNADALESAPQSGYRALLSLGFGPSL